MLRKKQHHLSGVLWLRQSAASVPPVFGIPLLVVQSGVAFQRGTSFSFCTAQTEINCAVALTGLQLRRRYSSTVQTKSLGQT